MGGVQCGQHLGGVQARGLGQRAGDDLEGLGILADGVLRQPRGALAEGGDALEELHLRGAGAGDEARVAGDGLDDVDAVVDGALDVVEVVLRRAAQDQRCGAGRVVLLPEDGDAVAADLERLDDVDGAHLVGHGGPEAGERCGAHDAAQAAELEFREDLDDEDGVAVEVVQRELADGGAGDEDAQAGVVQLLDGGFELALLALGEGEHLLGVVQEDGAFGFRLGDVDRAGEDADFGAPGFLDRAVGLAAEDHAFDDARLRERAAHDFDDADVVDVEVEGVLGQDREDGFGDEVGEEVFAAGLLGGDDGADGFAEFGLRPDVFDLVDYEFCSLVSIASRRRNRPAEKCSTYGLSTSAPLSVPSRIPGRFHQLLIPFLTAPQPSSAVPPPAQSPCS